MIAKQKNYTEHIANRYGMLMAVAGIIALVCIQRGWAVGYVWHIATVVSLWALAILGILYASYMENEPWCFGKREDGTISIVGRFVFFPYFFILWVRHLIIVQLSHENPYDELCEGVFIGSYPRNGRIPEGTKVSVDLMAEAAASKLERKTIEHYVAFPILEAGIRSVEDLIQCIDALPETGVYIHCAQGHGRTGFFTCAYLLRRGKVQTLPQALEWLRRVRPKAKLRQGQIAFLEAHVNVLSKHCTSKSQ